MPDPKFGFQGWTIEEVLTDVMGMTDTRTETFNSILSRFQRDIDEENYERANEMYDEVDKLLHPENNLRKLLRFQLASIK